jgi:hypothetical protein
MHVHCDKNPAHAEGVIRHPAVLLLAAAGIVSTLIYFTINSSTGGSWQSQQQHDTRLRELMGWWDAPGLAKPRFKGAIADHMDFQHYYVAPSTVPGAGLGVFARHDMPPGVVACMEWCFSPAVFPQLCFVTAVRCRAMEDQLQCNSCCQLRSHDESPAMR